ncbi:MAG: YbdK family carboxylate-amine ligase [Gaiellaceae bacterium]
MAIRQNRAVRAAEQGTGAFAVTEPPAWEVTPPLTVGGCRATFEHATSFTVGVEEELMLVERRSLELAPAIDDVLPLLGGDTQFSKELRAAQIEIVTPVCATAADACRQLASSRRRLLEALPARLALLAAGTHPFSTDHGGITAADRYRQIADEYVWAATRSLVCGLHVHVAVAGADRALAVYNALRSYLPELAAIGANSPFADGRHTGMASVRPKFNEIYPRSGIPPVFETWEQLVDYVDWGRSGGLFPDPTHFWWEMRPHPVHGTIEIRVLDTQTRVDDAAALVAFVQSLVALLTDRYDANGVLPVHQTHWIAENAWRAHRHGVRGWLVDLDTGLRVPTRERLAALLSEVEPFAEALDSGEQLRHARTLLAGNGADRQRYVEARDGILDLTRWLVDDTEASALDA